MKKTLQSMAAGGIHDQVGGGFHRYSTDRFWLVPHFEKMLYDNALLARVYLETYQVTGEPTFLETAIDTLDWMLREMTGPEGAFHSAQDADTPDGEGYYYTWTPAETEEVLGKNDSRIFDELFGVVPEGNFEGGRSILHVMGSVERTASKFGVEPGSVKGVVTQSKAKLLEARKKRARPAVDDKVLSSWNGLAISALACAYQVTGERRYLDASARAADFILSALVVSDKLFRRYRDGAVAVEATLEDYSFLAAGLLDLYESGFDARYLRSAIRLAEKMNELFWDAGGGGFFMSSSPDVLVKVKEGYDGPTPSGNAAARSAPAPLRVHGTTGLQGEGRDYAEGLRRLDGVLAHLAHLHALRARLLVRLEGGRGRRLDGGEGYRDMVREIQRRFLPNKVVALATDDVPETSSLTEGKTEIGGRPTVYICENFACKSPVTKLESLREQLGA